MAGRRTEVKIILLAVVVGGTTFFHYFTEWKVHHYHVFYQGLYFLPVMLAGFWFALRGGLATSLSITILLLPFTITHWNGFSADDFNRVMELVLYNVFAVILGKLRDQERIVQKHLREAERFAAMGKTVSGLAHELKTPLIAIGGLSRLVRRTLEKKDPLVREKLDIVVEETNRLEKMVTEMLDFSRPLELQQTKGNMNLVVGQCLAIISHFAKEKEVEVQNLSTEDLPIMSFDAERMKQVLINLLTNAIQASSQGEKVSIYSYQMRRKLIIDVKDRGSGIPLDKKEEIFSPFFTTKEGGTGLGLPIAKKIVEAHRGYLEVLENSEKGTTFRVVIPVE